MGDKNEIRRFFEIYNYLMRKDIKKMCNLDHFYYQELLKEKEQLDLLIKSTEKVHSFISLQDVYNAVLDLSKSISNVDRVHLEPFLGDVSHPIYYFTGPPGSGKTTKAKQLKKVLTGDDSVISTRGKNKEDLPLLFSQKDIVVWDNAEPGDVDPTMHQLLCALATGGGHFQRKSYSGLQEQKLSLPRERACRL